MSFIQYAELTVVVAALIAAAAWHLHRNPVRPCPRCGGVGWVPKSGRGDWMHGGKPCRRCDRYGLVTVGVVWMARLVGGRGGRHPRTRLQLLPMPDRAGRQDVTL
jgi:hypothetical protein